MGGWIALQLARMLPDRVKAIVGVAAAADFPQISIMPYLTAQQRKNLDEEGYFEFSFDSTSAPPIFLTKKMLEDCHKYSIFESDFKLHCPVYLLQGAADTQVSVDWALKIFHHVQSHDMRMLVLKNGTHSFSEPENLELISQAIEMFL
jgi:esterase/lipase